MTDQAITDTDEVRPDHQPLTKPVLFAYSLPATPLALAGLPMGVYLPVIYADHFGLSLVVSVGYFGLRESRMPLPIRGSVIGPIG